MTTEPVRAVLWDADGVLQERVPSWRGIFAQLLGDRTEEFGAAVWGDLEAALAGQLDMDAHLDEVIEGQGLAEQRTAIRDVWAMIRPLPESRELVAKVRRAGTPCYLATNQDNLRTSYMRRLLAYDDLLDGCYYSCEVGAAKPHAPYFLHVAADLGLAPGELLFIDDQPENVAGALEVGLRAELWQHDLGVEVLHTRFTELGVAL